MYAVAKVLSDKFEKLQMSRHTLAELMGYKNISKGVQRITLFFQGKFYNQQFVNKMFEILNIDEELKKMSDSITKEQIKSAKRNYELQCENDYLLREIEQRKKFKPFIFRKTSLSRPTQIFPVALCGGEMKYKILSERFSSKSLEDQKLLASRFIRIDYRIKNGVCPYFGRITGYFLKYSYDNSIEYDVNGQILKNKIEDLVFYPSPSATPYVHLK